MKVIDGIHVLSFEEWKKIPSVLEMEEGFEDCPTCGGDGKHECDCGNIHDCNDCDGNGKSQNLDKIYREELRKELQLFLDWKNGVPKKVVSIKSKKP